MQKRIPLIVITGLLFVLCFSVSAQNAGEGTLNTWTIKPFERLASSEPSYLRSVRAARQGDFDRVVFEFEGSVPNYSIKYLPSRFYESEAGRERIRIAGSRFVEVNLHIIPMDDKQLAFSDAKGFVPRGRLRMPAVLQVAAKNHFEGYYDFLLGVRGRKPFRVSELSNPSRLVIDFKAVS